MPHLTLALTSDGLEMAVMIGLTGKDIADLVATGQPVPRPILLRGVIDTGTNITVVAAAALSPFGLLPMGSGMAHTVSGSQPARLFEVSFSIPAVGRLTAPFLVLDRLEVMEWTAPPSGIEVLIGRDVLADLLTILDGPRQQFTLGD